MRLLLRDVGRNRLDQVRRRRRASILRQRRVGGGRPPLREHGVHHQDAGRHEALASIRGRGKTAKQFLLAGNDAEPGSDKIVELLEVAPQNDHGRFDVIQRLRAERGALEGGAQRFEAGHLDGDGGRDLAVLSLAGRRQHRRRGGGNPLGLARQLQRSDRRRHPILGDALDDIADLEKGVQCSGGRKHREGADPKKSEKQATADAEATEHRCTRRPDRCRQRFLHEFLESPLASLASIAPAARIRRPSRRTRSGSEW